MSRNKMNYRNSEKIEVKSKFEAEFRRIGINKTDFNNLTNFESFLQTLKNLHHLNGMDFYILYVDPTDNDLLPINNDDNFNRALKTAKPLLRILLQRKSLDDFYPGYYGSLKPKTKILGILGGGNPTPVKPKGPQISTPHDFHLVSSIIDVDTVPETCRRVRLLKHGSDKPLGFYIRDGTSVRVTSSGLEKQPGIFISRLVPGGLAESTGLLAVNDEILEVNGIEVNGKSLDQVTDMMVANSSNLIITVKPANQRNVPMATSRRESFVMNDQQSDDENDVEDEVIDLMSAANKDNVLHL